VTDGRFDGRTIVVVGASVGGMGGATALRCASEGGKVVVGDVQLDHAEAVVASVESAGGVATALSVDLADPESIERFYVAAEKAYGAIDGVLNVVGAGSDNDTDAVDVDLDVFDRIININLRGTFLSCRAAIPALVRAGGGAIANIGSIRGLAGTPRLVSYSCSKAAIIALTRHIATEMGPGRHPRPT